MAGQKAHNAESDVFNKLVPFWQLELYFGEVKGNTPMKRTDHGGFYADIYEKVRTTANPTTDGLCQLEFVYNSCVSAGMDSVSYTHLDVYKRQGYESKEISISHLKTYTVELSEATCLLYTSRCV